MFCWLIFVEWCGVHHLVHTFGWSNLWFGNHFSLIWPLGHGRQPCYKACSSPTVLLTAKLAESASEVEMYIHGMLWGQSRVSVSCPRVPFGSTGENQTQQGGHSLENWFTCAYLKVSHDSVRLLCSYLTFHVYTSAVLLVTPHLVRKVSVVISQKRLCGSSGSGSVSLLLWWECIAVDQAEGEFSQEPIQSPRI